jgi:hypothetical protein
LALPRRPNVPIRQLLYTLIHPISTEGEPTHLRNGLTSLRAWTNADGRTRSSRHPDEAGVADRHILEKAA